MLHFPTCHTVKTKQKQLKMKNNSPLGNSVVESSRRVGAVHDSSDDDSSGVSETARKRNKPTEITSNCGSLVPASELLPGWECNNTTRKTSIKRKRRAVTLDRFSFVNRKWHWKQHQIVVSSSCELHSFVQIFQGNWKVEKADGRKHQSSSRENIFLVWTCVEFDDFFPTF